MQPVNFASKTMSHAEQKYFVCVRTGSRSYSSTEKATNVSSFFTRAPAKTVTSVITVYIPRKEI